MTELAGDSIDRVDIKQDQDYFPESLDSEQTIAYKSFTILRSNDVKHVQYWRSVSSEDVEQQKLDVMPGFRLHWWYTRAAELVPDSFYQEEKLVKQFVR